MNYFYGLLGIWNQNQTNEIGNPEEVLVSWELWKGIGVLGILKKYWTIGYVLHVLHGTVPMSTMCVLCFKLQIPKGTLGTKLDTRSILCFIHEKWSLEPFIFSFGNY